MSTRKKRRRATRNYPGAPADEGEPLPKIETRPVKKVRKRSKKAKAPVPDDGTGGVFWPEGEPMPVAMPRRPARPVVPCRECRRLYVRGGGQAVYIRSSDKVNAYCRCRACGARFSMPLGPVPA